MSDRLIEKLAVFKQLPEIVKLIEENQITFVFVDTGCGKSIGIPWALIRKDYCANKKGYRIICTQPTITAAISLCEFQTKLSPNFKIEYAAEGERNYDQNTNAIYATAGHIRKIMERYFKDGKASHMDFTDYLMIDEIHGGTKDNSVIIYLWGEARRQGVRVPKLILSTATDPGSESVTKNLRGAIFRSDFRHFPVQVRYHKRNYDLDGDDIYADMAKVAVDLFLETKGHGIIFMPGSAEVEDAVLEIQSELRRRNISDKFNRPIRVLQCYAQCKREEVLLAVRDEEDPSTPDPCYKFVVGTNLIETSLTIPNVKFVVDTLREKRITTVSGRSHLATTNISKNSADQRKGRTGRTIAGGICYRMCQDVFYKELEDTRPAEILRTPICDVAIEFYSIGLDPELVVTELDLDKLREAKLILMQTECIIEVKQKVVVTDIGMFVKDIPMDVRNAVALYLYVNGNSNNTTASTNTNNQSAESLDQDISAGLAELTKIIDSQDYGQVEKFISSRRRLEKLLESKDECIFKPASQENIFWAIVAIVVGDSYGPPLCYYFRKEKNEKHNDYAERIEVHKEKNFKQFEANTPLLSMVYMVKDMFDAFPDTHLNTNPFKTKKWCADRCINNKKMREIVVQIKRIQKILYDMYGPKHRRRFTKPKGEKVAQPRVVPISAPTSNAMTNNATITTKAGVATLDDRQMRAKARITGKSIPLVTSSPNIKSAPITSQATTSAPITSQTTNSAATTTFADVIKGTTTTNTINDEETSQEMEQLLKEDFVCVYADSSDLQVSQIFPKLTKCFKTAYVGIMITNNDSYALSHDSKLVQIDKLKTVFSMFPSRGASDIKASKVVTNDKTTVVKKNLPHKGKAMLAMTTSKMSAADLESSTPTQYIPVSEIQIKNKGKTTIIVSLWIPIYQTVKLPSLNDFISRAKKYPHDSSDDDSSSY